jgi:hypothetical protein
MILATSNLGSRRATPLILLTASLVTVLILAWGFLRSPLQAFDDAYITYRYADNWRQGLGLVYNPGEWVLGTTTPLFALVLGVVGLFGSDVETLGHWIGVLSWLAVAGTGMGLLLQTRRPHAAVAAGLLLAVEPSMLSSLGMETSLLVALMLGTAWAWLAGRRALTVVLAAALILARQDSALWLLLLGAEIWRRNRSIPWRVTAGTVLLVSPWFMYAWWRYGSVLPNSALAKLGQNRLMPVEGQSTYAQALLQISIRGLHPTGVLVMAGLLALGVWIVLRHARSLWWLLAWMVSYIAIYSWLGVVSFPWYFVPPLAVTGLIVALPLGSMLGDKLAHCSNLAEQQSSRPGRRCKAWQRLSPVLAVSLLALLLAARGRHMLRIRAGQGYRPAYRAVGQWLNHNTHSGSSVASIEIGVIGYLSQRQILDTMGLVTPDMRQHQVGWAETLAYAINVHRPDYAIVLPGTAWDAIVDRWWFQEEYEPVVQFDDVTIYGRYMSSDADHHLPAQIDYAPGVSLTGLTVNSLSLQPRTDLEVWLDVEVQSTPESRYVLTLFLVDAQTFERHAEVTTAPLDGRYSSNLWQPGDRLSLPMRLNLPQGMEPGAYQLGLTLYDGDQQAAVRLRDEPDNPNPDIRVGWFRLGSPQPPPDLGLVAHPVRVEWQDGLALRQLRLPAQPLMPGTTLPVGFSWQSSELITRDLTVFVHVLDADGAIVAQQDRRPFRGRWPTPVWQPGELLQDTHEISLPAALPPGLYSVYFGLYDEAGRLPLADESGDSWLSEDLVRVVSSP